MKFMAGIRGISYGLLDRWDVADMVRLLAEAFSRREPTAMAVGMSLSDVEKGVAIFAPKAIAEGLTMVARDSAGELVGAMLTEDFGTPSPFAVADAPARFAPVGALLGSLDEEYRETHRVVPGSHLHLFMVGVKDSLTGSGIARHMITLCLANGAGLGYGWAVAEATGRISQHIFRKLGFRDLCTRSYKEFLYEGRRVFEPVEEHGGTILVERSVVMPEGTHG